MGRENRTSLTHPIYVDWLPGMAPGAVGLTLAPGKSGRSAMGNYRWRRDLTTDLVRLKEEFGVTRLVCLLEDRDFITWGIENYDEEVGKLWSSYYHFAIPDGGTPSSPWAIQPLIERIDADARKSPDKRHQRGTRQVEVGH